MLADLDASSTVLRIGSLVTIYSILLGCEGKVLADACKNVVRCATGCFRMIRQT